MKKIEGVKLIAHENKTETKVKNQWNKIYNSESRAYPER